MIWFNYRVSFLTGAPLKVLSVRLHSKTHQKSSQCQNLLTEKKLVILRGASVKKDLTHKRTLCITIICKRIFVE